MNPDPSTLADLVSVEKLTAGRLLGAIEAGCPNLDRLLSSGETTLTGQRMFADIRDKIRDAIDLPLVSFASVEHCRVTWSGSPAELRFTTRLGGLLVDAPGSNVADLIVEAVIVLERGAIVQEGAAQVGIRGSEHMGHCRLSLSIADPDAPSGILFHEEEGDIRVQGSYQVTPRSPGVLRIDVCYLSAQEVTLMSFECRPALAALSPPPAAKLHHSPDAESWRC